LNPIDLNSMGKNS